MPQRPSSCAGEVARHEPEYHHRPTRHARNANTTISPATARYSLILRMRTQPEAPGATLRFVPPYVRPIGIRSKKSSPSSKRGSARPGRARSTPSAPLSRLRSRSSPLTSAAGISNTANTGPLQPHENCSSTLLARSPRSAPSWRARRDRTRPTNCVYSTCRALPDRPCCPRCAW